jgi:hypothetical protein
VSPVATTSLYTWFIRQKIQYLLDMTDDAWEKFCWDLREVTLYIFYEACEIKGHFFLCYEIKKI